MPSPESYSYYPPSKYNINFRLLISKLDLQEQNEALNIKCNRLSRANQQLNDDLTHCSDLNKTFKKTNATLNDEIESLCDDYDSTILTYMKTNAILNDEIESLCYAALDAEHEVQNAKIGIAGLRKIIINQKNINIFDHDAKCNMNEVMDIIEDHT